MSAATEGHFSFNGRYAALTQLWFQTTKHFVGCHFKLGEFDVNEDARACLSRWLRCDLKMHAASNNQELRCLSKAKPTQTALDPLNSRKRRVRRARHMCARDTRRPALT
jgi:hypothetical protein